MRIISGLIYKTFSPIFFSMIERKFKRIAQRPEATQEKVLNKLLSSYSKTQFGRDHGLTSDLRYEDFTAKVPIHDYADLSSYLEKERAGFHNTIVSDRIVVWEKTSGSSGKAKYIPYTFSLLRSFQRMLFLWAGDLILHGPKFKTGKMFFSISPPFYDKSQEKVVRNHSFEDDSEYLPWIVRKAVGDSLINPKGLKSIQDPHSFKLYLCAHLVSHKDLEIIFVWSPSYLIELVQFIQSNRNKLIEILTAGSFHYKGRTYHVPKRQGLEDERLWDNLELLWKDLKLISCWTDGSAQLFLPKLKSCFPTVRIQGKGLLATEGPMTFPLENAEGPVPLPEDIFYEFIADDGKIKLLHQLEKEQTYKILISHRSGLLRYSIGDEVKVVGFYEKLPCLKFLGRSGNFSDLTGEKLNESRIQEIFIEALKPGECACLLPIKPEDGRPYYVCLYDGTDPHFLSIIENKLMDTFHYMQSRKLGQLEELKLIKVPSVEEAYLNFYLNRGMILGDIKFTTLIRNPEIASELVEGIANA